MSALRALALLRPVNLIGLWAAVEVGARLAGAKAPLVATLVPCAVAAFGYARNDAVDAAADRWNRPDRPVPSRAVSPRAAIAVSWTCLAAAWALWWALGLGAPHAGLLVIGSVALYIYSPWGKEWGAGAPGLIALLAALAVFWGAGLGPHWRRAAAAALLAAGATFARECVKDLEDLEGDRAVGKRTWAVRSGPGPVARAARGAAAVALFALPAPWLLGVADLRYLCVAGAVGAPAFGWVWLRSGAYDRAAASLASKALKAALFAGLAGLWIGATRAP